MIRGEQYNAIQALNISGQGKRRGRRNSTDGSSRFIKWARIGLIILGACNAIVSKPQRPGLSREDEKDMLKMKAANLRKQLEDIENRIAALERETQSQGSEYK